MTMKSEEPDITTISIRPGVVDTEMQRELREVHHDRLDKKDQEKFMNAKAHGTCGFPLPLSTDLEENSSSALLRIVSKSRLG